jgi:hypothetical protein
MNPDETERFRSSSLRAKSPLATPPANPWAGLAPFTGGSENRASSALASSASPLLPPLSPRPPCHMAGCPLGTQAAILGRGVLAPWGVMATPSATGGSEASHTLSANFSCGTLGVTAPLRLLQWSMPSDGLTLPRWDALRQRAHLHPMHRFGVPPIQIPGPARREPPLLLRIPRACRLQDCSIATTPVRLHCTSLHVHCTSLHVHCRCIAPTLHATNALLQ